MKLSIQPTNLSSETLNRIERVAVILGKGGDAGYMNQVATTLVGLAELGYQDALLSQAVTRMADLPNEYAGSYIGNGRIGEELN